MPDDIAIQALATCERLREQVARAVEPFAKVGLAWPHRFAHEAGVVRSTEQQSD
jgi:hypothetical protein